MNKVQLNDVLKSISVIKKGQKRIDKAKAAALDDGTKFLLVNHLVRVRGPILTELIGPMTDRTWLAASGYLYPYSRNGFNFLGTCAHSIH